MLFTKVSLRIIEAEEEVRSGVGSVSECEKKEPDWSLNKESKFLACFKEVTRTLL